MKRTIALLLSLLMCLSAVVFALPASADALGKNLLLDATYEYLEYNSFLSGNSGDCSDNSNKLLNDGKVRGEDVEFNDFYGVPGTTVEIAGTYDATVIEFTLKELSYVNCLVFRGVRRNGNRYLNIVSIHVAGENGVYSEVSFEESSVAIEGAPKSQDANEDQYFDITATFDQTQMDVKKIRVDLNTQASSGYKYVVSFDELEAYGFATGSYTPAATMAISGPATAAKGSVITVNAYVNAITTPNGLVACDLPLVYDKTKLQLVSATPIVPDNWEGKYINLSAEDKNTSPYWLSVACDADDLLTNDDYYVTADNKLGFAITFKAIANGDAVVSIDNNIETENFILAVDAVGFVNYGVNGMAHTITISGEGALTYVIDYNANGGSGAPTAHTKNAGETVNLSTTVPTRDGFEFLGWATSADATEAEYAAGASYSTDADLTLYAVWSEGTSDGVEVLLGDVTRDDKVDNLDAAYVLRYDAELISFDETTAVIGDVNKDGTTDSLDAASILRYDAGLITQSFGTVTIEE